MCGISGFVRLHHGLDMEATGREMATAMVHRGPDDEGIYIDKFHRLGLVHRRLSIIDLSPQGHQPMISASGRFVFVFNGEIYNFHDIRKELESARLAPQWRGHSDTEVILAAIEAWGVEVAVQKAVGMFAFALFDKETNILHLGRDRIGEKPLYYGETNDGFFFASELKSIKAVQKNLNIDNRAVFEFIQFGYIPNTQCIYENFNKLLPGHILEVNTKGKIVRSYEYWSLNRPNKFLDEFRRLSQDELVSKIHAKLSESVKMQMVSDVPVGSFLSGGIDSSTITAMMQEHSSTPINTFTIGFNEEGFNEAPYASQVAKYLGTNHTELFLTASDAMEIVPKLSSIYDEPFADSSQIPTILVSQLTRSKVTVSLSGDGGDELFAGYERYILVEALWNRIKKFPRFIRSTLALSLCSLNPSVWDAFIGTFSQSSLYRVNGRRIHKFADLLSSRNLGEMYVGLMSSKENLVNIKNCKYEFNSDSWLQPGSENLLMRRWDILQYLPDDLLVKVDRATMSASLEARAPFLNYELVEMALALPQSVLVKNGQSKWILRQILHKYVPESYFDRPKAGFSIPLSLWLRGPLKKWGEDLIFSMPVDSKLNKKALIKIWEEHQSNKFDRGTCLWNALIYLAWVNFNI